jgi:hypothetical protein
VKAEDEDLYTIRPRSVAVTLAEAADQYSKWQADRDMAKWRWVEQYTTWLEIGWDPFEYSELGGGGKMWTFLRDFPSCSSTICNDGIRSFGTPFNGESDIFTEMHKECAEDRGEVDEW